MLFQGFFSVGCFVSKTTQLLSSLTMTHYCAKLSSSWFDTTYLEEDGVFNPTKNYAPPNKMASWDILITLGHKLNSPLWYSLLVDLIAWKIFDILVTSKTAQLETACKPPLRFMWLLHSFLPMSCNITDSCHFSVVTNVNANYPAALSPSHWQATLRHKAVTDDLEIKATYCSTNSSWLNSKYPCGRVVSLPFFKSHSHTEAAHLPPHTITAVLQRLCGAIFKCLLG